MVKARNFLSVLVLLLSLPCLAAAAKVDGAAVEQSCPPAEEQTPLSEEPPPCPAGEEEGLPPEEELLCFPCLGEKSKCSGIFSLLPQDGQGLEIDMVAYYLDAMTQAAQIGDVEAGREAQADRDALIDKEGRSEAKIDFDQLYLLARLIHGEAGSDWLGEDFRMAVGEVALNRVASPEFPNTLQEVVYQKGQYACAGSPGFETMAPGEKSVSAALKLLQGSRQLVPSVVFQSEKPQGEIFTVFSDLRLGRIFFCLSNNLDLYSE